MINKKIVVLGGTTGIGFAVADALSDAGGEVIIGSSSQAKLELENLADRRERFLSSMWEIEHSSGVARRFPRSQRLPADLD